MPIKGWYDLSPHEIVEAILNLNRKSFSGQNSASADLVRSRLKAIRGLIPPEELETAQNHLGSILRRPGRKK